MQRNTTGAASEAPYVTAQDVAAVLGVHRRTIIRLANAGAIPAIRVGAQYRFLLDDCIAALRAAQAGSDGRSTTARQDKWADE